MKDICELLRCTTDADRLAWTHKYVLGVEPAKFDAFLKSLEPVAPEANTATV